MSLDDTKLQALKELCDEGKLLIDVIGILDAKKAPQAIRDGVLFKKNSSPLGPLDREAYLTVRHWKRFLDGSFGSHTAWLSGFYSDKETYGESQEDFPELFLQARNALRSGFYLSFHVIGDAALDQALMLGEKLKLEMKSRSVSDGLNPLTPTQHRLEHVQLCRNDQLLTIKNQGFWSLAIQPSHRVLDDKFIHSRLGSKRYEDFAYRLATFEKNLIPFAVSSDAPIAGFNPQENFLANQKHPEKEKLNFDSLIWKMTTGGRLALGANSPLLKRGSTVRMSARSCINDKI
jgi:predicted amidohydrolase YtcJ